MSDPLQSIIAFYQGSNPIPGISAVEYINELGLWMGTSGESFSGEPKRTDLELILRRLKEDITLYPFT